MSIKTNGDIVRQMTKNEDITLDEARRAYSIVFKAVEDVLFREGKVLIPTIGTLSIEYYYKTNHKEVGSNKIASIAKARVNFKASRYLKNKLSSINVPTKGKWYKDDKGNKWQFLRPKSKSATASLQKLVLKRGDEELVVNSCKFYKDFKEV